MKFDILVASLLNEMDVERLAKQDPREVYEEPIDDFVEFVKSIPGPQLEKIFREDLYTYYTSIEGTSNEDEAQDRIEIIANELLKKGLMPEDISTIYRQVHDEVKGTSDK